MSNSFGLELFLKTHDLHDADDIETLLEVVDVTRQFLADGRYDALARLIRYAVDEQCFEALSWILALLQEAYEAQGSGPAGDAGGPEDFTCELGRSIPGYDAFLASLEVDPDVAEYSVEKEFDDVGEERSFFNICTYRTKYPNICLVSSENIDYLDSDYIQYQLRFRKEPAGKETNR